MGVHVRAIGLQIRAFGVVNPRYRVANPRFRGNLETDNFPTINLMGNSEKLARNVFLKSKKLHLKNVVFAFY